jgi:hypothetical protein
MEVFNGRFTLVLAPGARETENRSLLVDAQKLEDLQLVVGERMEYHNGMLILSTIGIKHLISSSSPSGCGYHITNPGPEKCLRFGMHRR